MRTISAFILLSVFSVYAGELSELFEKTATKEPIEFDDRGNFVGSRPFFMDRKPTDITEVAIERSGCYGTCPIYTAKISADGTVNYFGKKYVKRKGHFTAKIFPNEFQNLAEFIKEIKFSDFRNTYDASVTDCETVYTMVTYGSKTKLISNYADSGPVNLWATEKLIDKLIEGASDWKKVD